MQIHVILPLISAIFVFILGNFIFLKRRSKLNNIFFLLSLTITVWLFGTFMMFLSKEDTAMIFWDRFVYMGVVFMPVLLYHFSLTLTGIKRKKFLFYGAYSLSFAFFILSQTDYFVSGLFKYRWGVHTRAHFFHHLFLVYFIFYAGLSLLNFYQCLQTARSAFKKNQIKYVFFAFLILIVVGSLAYLPAYGIGVYPFSYLSGVVFVIVLAYAIIRYRLMDIKVVITRGLLYTLLVLYVVGTFTFLSFIVGDLLKEIVGLNPVIITILISLIIVLSLDPLKKIFARLTDRIFFEGRVDYSEVLRKLSKIIAEELDLERLLELLIKNIIKELKVKKVYILMISGEEDFFYFKDHRRGVKISAKSPLINYLKTSQEIIITEELEREISDLENGGAKEGLEKIKSQLNSIGASLCAPIIINQKLTVILVLDNKSSGDMYTQEDLRLFEVLAPQLGAALEKSKLYKEVQSFSEKLEKEVGRATRANIHLQQLDQAKTEFISIASHQLRTPLTGLKGYLSMLLEGDFGEIEPKKKKILHDLFENTNRLIRLIDLMLNISRIEAGQLKIEKKSVQMEQLVEEVLRIFIPLAEKKGIKLEFKKPVDILPLVMVDSDKIKDVISNLIDNSIKYTTQGKINVNVEQKESKIIFSVQDTGIGITKKESIELFKKFSRSNRVARIYTGGTGLGLYIAEKIIKIHGGRIWAESEGEGKGSRFFFSLPIFQSNSV